MLSIEIRNNIVAESREWLGTPFNHMGRQKGIQCDCVGLIIGVYNEVGLLNNYEPKPYGKFAKPNTVRNILLVFCEEIDDLEDAVEGDILLFNIKGFEQHLAILTEKDTNKIIHAFQGPNVVSEHSMNNWWLNRISGIFRFVGDI